MSSLTPTGPSATAPRASPGDRLGEFTLVDLLGTGGTAEVWRAHDAAGAEVALKIHAFDPGEDWRVPVRFRIEGELLHRARHPNILAVFTAEEDEQRAWIAMELAHGGSVLQAMSRSGPMTAERAARLMIDVLSAVQHAHDLGIVHRDIKPQNLLLTGSGRICLADFGVARADPDLRRAFTEPATSLGSMSYMPPEQRLDARAVTPAADLYACGATLFAMVTNRSPVDLHLTPLTHPRWNRVAPPLRPIIQRATRYIPAERHSNARAMAMALEAALPSLRDEGAETEATFAEREDPTPPPWAGSPEETTERANR